MPDRTPQDNQNNGRNKYIPQFISNAPWYQSESLDPETLAQQKSRSGEQQANEADEDYLKHQRLNPNEGKRNFSIAQRGQGIQDSYKEVVDIKLISDQRQKHKPLSSVRNSNKRKLLAFKNRNQIKCSNCGSFTHKRAECLEKPRKVTVQYRDEAEQEILEQNNTKKIKVRDEQALKNYDAKRDNYYGFTEEEWVKSVEQTRAAKKRKEEEEAKRKETVKGCGRLGDGEEESDEEDDEEQELAELGLIGDTKTINTIKQDSVKAPGEKTIRLLEDRASYLESVTAKEQHEEDNDEEFVRKLTYNPKTRSIIDPNMGEFNEKNLFVRHLDGEAAEYELMKQFAWNAKRKISETNKEPDNVLSMLEHHPEASPTAMMLEVKKKKEEQKQKKLEKKKALLAKYGVVSEVKEV